MKKEKTNLLSIMLTYLTISNGCLMAINEHSRIAIFFFSDSNERRWENVDA